MLACPGFRRNSRRAEVCEYPTDFSPMNVEDIDRLTLRGEFLTRLLISYYLPDL